MNSSKILIVAALSGFIAVGMGAFGAHALKPLIEASLYSAYQTGVEYQFYHTLALLFVGGNEKILSHWQQRVSWAFIAGIALFSGSLYLMAVSGVRMLGIITPIGGCAFLVGWAMLAYAAWCCRR